MTVCKMAVLLLVASLCALASAAKEAESDLKSAILSSLKSSLDMDSDGMVEEGAFLGLDLSLDMNKTTPRAYKRNYIVHARYHKGEHGVPDWERCTKWEQGDASCAKDDYCVGFMYAPGKKRCRNILDNFSGFRALRVPKEVPDQLLGIIDEVFKGDEQEIKDSHAQVAMESLTLTDLKEYGSDNVSVLKESFPNLSTIKAHKLLKEIQAATVKTTTTLKDYIEHEWPSRIYTVFRSDLQTHVYKKFCVGATHYDQKKNICTKKSNLCGTSFPNYMSDAYHDKYSVLSGYEIGQGGYTIKGKTLKECKVSCENDPLCRAMNVHHLKDGKVNCAKRARIENLGIKSKEQDGDHRKVYIRSVESIMDLACTHGGHDFRKGVKKKKKGGKETVNRCVKPEELGFCPSEDLGAPRLAP